MKLLEKLAPLSVPLPMPYKKWEQQAMEGASYCDECGNEGVVECPECDGERDCQCGCPSCEGDCPECDGAGVVRCECAQGYSYREYVSAYARDIRLIFDQKRFVMLADEIEVLAYMNASIAQRMF